MHIGTQMSGGKFAELGDPYLKQLAQLGVRNVCIDPEGNPHDWTDDILARHIDRLDRAGLSLDMVQLPLASRPISENRSKNIMLGKSPERDREIDSICRLIERLAVLGVPAVKYNMNIIGIPRIEPAIGRGGARNSTWRLADATDGDTLTEAGEVSAEEFWSRIDYFLERVVPVAESAKVRMACHPHDPPTPEGYRGVTRVLATVDGLKKFVQMHESPYHGLNFCQGTIAEGMVNPREEIGDAIRWFGERNKIFNVHFRNIRGGLNDFQETFPDDGDMDMVASFKLYHELGYRHMIMPDHVPGIDGNAPWETAFAYCFGYINALFQATGIPQDGAA
ncbi:mannonate dehydratase (plasmid) [Falsihalocynthiibacter sp. SS001]|uniref:mannonate dehydratase n=1 Tax=Falsihalocynthiibacter sp. SS001 TaxID=3349698 RepID=UPI0036D22B9A